MVSFTSAGATKSWWWLRSLRILVRLFAMRSLPRPPLRLGPLGRKSLKSTFLHDSSNCNTPGRQGQAVLLDYATAEAMWQFRQETGQENDSAKLINARNVALG